MSWVRFPSPAPNSRTVTVACRSTTVNSLSGLTPPRWSATACFCASTPRLLRPCRVTDTSGALWQEYIHSNRHDPEVLRNEITTIDHALTRPWTLTRGYRHEREAAWFEHPCERAYSQHLFIGRENYFFSAGGRLMPARKGQPAPDLRYLDQPR
jgi:hypothetical protein